MNNSDRIELDVGDKVSIQLRGDVLPEYNGQEGVIFRECGPAHLAGPGEIAYMIDTTAGSIQCSTSELTLVEAGSYRLQSDTIEASILKKSLMTLLLEIPSR